MNQAADVSERSRADHSALISRLIVLVVVLGALILFIVKNSQEVDIDLVFWDRSLPLAWGLLIAGALGVVIGLLLPWIRRLR